MATPKSPPRRLLSRAPKVTAIVVSTIAALGSILSFARSYGIVGDSDSPHLTVGDFAVAWVGVTPSADTATAIGDTIHLAATMTDRRGRVLVGATLVWSSAEPGVASVGSTGTVVARGPGTATIVATAGEHTARSRIMVRQHVASVRIGDAGPLHLKEGESRSIDAHALDRRGYVIVGRRPTWRSA